MLLNLRLNKLGLVGLMMCVGMGCTSKTRDIVGSIRQTPAEQTALLNVELGLGYLKQEERARAKAKLTHALALAPQLAETQGAMAYFREMVGEHQEADRLYRQAIKVAALNKGAVYNNYGAYLCRQAQYEAADLIFQKALQDKTYARTAEVYENAGLCALKSTNGGVAQKAEPYLMQAVQHDPRLVQAKNALESLQKQRHQQYSTTGNLS